MLNFKVKKIIWICFFGIWNVLVWDIQICILCPYKKLVQIDWYNLQNDHEYFDLEILVNDYLWLIRINVVDV